MANQGYLNGLILASSLPSFLGTLTLVFLFARNENLMNSKVTTLGAGFALEFSQSITGIGFFDVIDMLAIFFGFITSILIFLMLEWMHA